MILDVILDGGFRTWPLTWETMASMPSCPCPCPCPSWPLGRQWHLCLLVQVVSPIDKVERGKNDGEKDPGEIFY